MKLVEEVVILGCVLGGGVVVVRDKVIIFRRNLRGAVFGAR